MSDQQQQDAVNEQQQQQPPPEDPPGLDSLAQVDETQQQQQEQEEETKSEQLQHDKDSNKDDDDDDDVFVNQGLRLWEQSRQQWLGRSDTDSTARPAAVPMEVDDIIEVVFNVSRQSAEDGPPKFPKSVPLPQMVDILVDLWEAEGLDI